jgi:hypothetical protein
MNKTRPAQSRWQDRLLLAKNCVFIIELRIEKVKKRRVHQTDSKISICIPIYFINYEQSGGWFMKRNAGWKKARGLDFCVGFLL